MAKQDDYGNVRKMSSQSRGGPRPALGNILPFTRYRGGIPYVPVRVGRRRGMKEADTQPFPDPPGSWMGTLPEWALYWAFESFGMKDRQDFQYQYVVDGGSIYDFYVFLDRIAIEIQGLFWHYEFEGSKHIISDRLRKIQAESVGITMIFIDEDHALTDPKFYLREALQGRDYSRSVRGIM